MKQARDQRPQPGRDDKVVASWNGLAIAALAEAGAAFDSPQWTKAAVAAATAVLDVQRIAGRIRRTAKDSAPGEAVGVLEDYGCLADGLLTLHQVTGTREWLDAALELLDTALAQFGNDEAPGAFHDTAADAEALVWRPSDPGDNASPSGASALAGALLSASALAGPDRAGDYRAAAEQAVARAGMLAARAPRFAGHWLTVAEALAGGPVQVAVVGAADDPARRELQAAAVAHAPGGSVVLAGEPDSAPLLADRPLVDGNSAAYVCRGYVCDRPVSSVDDLVSALGVHPG